MPEPTAQEALEAAEAAQTAADAAQSTASAALALALDPVSQTAKQNAEAAAASVNSNEELREKNARDLSIGNTGGEFGREP